MAKSLLLSNDRYDEIFYTYADYPICAPVSLASADLLLRRAALPDGARILDLGCGAAGWTRRALRHYPTAIADCIDISAAALAIARTAVSADGVAERVRFHECDVTTFEPGDRYDLVLCVGVSSFLGGLRSTLALAGPYVRPGGLILTGDNFWEREPHQDILDIQPRVREECLDLRGTTDLVTKAGWLPVYGHVSRLDEHDDYWWTTVGAANRWALDNSDDPAASEVHDMAAKALDQWLRLYRGVIGWVDLLLAPAGRQ
ncbi:SAM-dependent methyltransferase [Nocardia sp. NPDC051570]|uniref:SAM-dependent methyltransferase n=1 Tax=Nocardia sp. NPDC051570 TaxID=3364324 RepID=UPI00378C68E2